jgi:precorrin-6B methylase 2
MEDRNRFIGPEAAFIVLTTNVISIARENASFVLVGENCSRFDKVDRLSVFEFFCASMASL